MHRKHTLTLKEGKGKMGSLRVYRVVIDSSNGQGRYQKQYVGPATSEENAVEQARTVFKDRADDRLAAVEIFDTESWVEDTILRPTGAPR
jgi:hypothetical protein